ncbi:MAG: type IV pilin protein [Gammaproteobacteria bacterium]|jgi:type IV pilus assembly protein PilE
MMFNNFSSVSGKSASGFTLIEVLITIAILGILAAIVIPSYSAQTMKSRRTDAKIALAEAVKNLERCYITFNQYNHASCDSYPANGANMVVSSEGHYKIVATTLAQTNYVIEAQPLANSPQINDTHCDSFTLDSEGSKTATNADCW